MINISHIIKELSKNYVINKGFTIRFFCWWKIISPEKEWFYRFIKHRNIDKFYKGYINFYSVFGSIRLNRILNKGVNIFYTGENIQKLEYGKIKKHLQKQPFDLFIGFDYTNESSHFRFPLWLIYMFKPESSLEDIEVRLSEISISDTKTKTKNVSIVASHDSNGIRNEIIEEVSKICKVDSAGRFKNNTIELQLIFNNNKNEFLKQYKFNICPENSDSNGYVTEKIFEAIRSGCIPIYWGSNNCPEPEILNQNAILFWNRNGNNAETIQKIKSMIENENYYQDFISQPRFNSDAAEILLNYFNELEFKIKHALQNQFPK